MISLLCPTRGRPEHFNRMVESFRENTETQLEICCWLDQDDPRIDDYDMSLIDQHQLSAQGRCGSSAMYNGCAKLSNGDYLMMVNDDSVMRTPSWDVQFMRYIQKDDFFVAWPMSQGFQCTNPIVSRAWYGTLGYFVPDGYQWWYCDTALRTISDIVGRSMWIPSIYCEHMFYMFGKSQLDDTYKRNNSDDERKQDHAHYEKSKPWFYTEAQKIAVAILRATGYSVQPVGQ